VRAAGGLTPCDFLVDSGADVSLAPRDLGEDLGLCWEEGARRVLKGISKRRECQVETRLHTVNLVIFELGIQIATPVCFAVGRAPFVLGREGFFEHFRITLDRRALVTTFEFGGEIA
jgi:hypothetical protein